MHAWECSTACLLRTGLSHHWCKTWPPGYIYPVLPLGTKPPRQNHNCTGLSKEVLYIIVALHRMKLYLIFLWWCKHSVPTESHYHDAQRHSTLWAFSGSSCLVEVISLATRMGRKLWPTTTYNFVGETVRNECTAKFTNYMWSHSRGHNLYFCLFRICIH